jgi:hypothetical protein
VGKNGGGGNPGPGKGKGKGTRRAPRRAPEKKGSCRSEAPGHSPGKKGYVCPLMPAHHAGPEAPGPVQDGNNKKVACRSKRVLDRPGIKGARADSRRTPRPPPSPAALEGKDPARRHPSASAGENETRGQARAMQGWWCAEQRTCAHSHCALAHHRPAACPRRAARTKKQDTGPCARPARHCCRAGCPAADPRAPPLPW